ncbi:hypothetical protein BJF79_08170 [Actinomadura sp. CNU-125]|uniref:hypothetical protein n=1 Tax=Actinomadura sp. CNU-125 TaxID=1904961 RepID=UPI00095DB64D|nr:hypothetical protein [Actinomadura sp. CNU-125]OLT33243.1 hypothetical protein BJF79_08170 [Actinomadura sp. CNU-125]
MERTGTRSLASVPAGMLFDPELPAGLLAQLRAGEGALVLDRPGTAPGSYRFLRQHLLVGAVVFCLAVAVTELARRAGGTGWGAAAGIAAAFAYVPVNASDRRATALQSAGVIVCFFGLWAVWAIVLAEAFGTVTAPFGILHGFALAIFIAFGTPGTTHVIGRDRAVDPADLGPVERARLADVRDAARTRRRGRPAPRALVRRRARAGRAARGRMGDGVPYAGRAALPPSSNDLAANAATDRVRAVLRPRTESLAAARRADARVITQISAYLEPVGDAVRAHREWEQSLRIVDADDLAADPSPGFAGHPDLNGDLALEAVRLAREELTARAAASNAVLLDALRASERS